MDLVGVLELQPLLVSSWPEAIISEVQPKLTAVVFPLILFENNLSQTFLCNTFPALDSGEKYKTCKVQKGRMGGSVG